MNNKFKTKKWQGKVTINYSFIRALTKRVGKAERKLIALVINENDFLDKSITTEEFKTALMKYIYPVTIERAVKRFGKSQAMDEELFYETHPEDVVAYVDNGFYINYEILLRQYPDALFILTTRNLDDWTKSISQFQPRNDIPDVESYEKAVRELFQGEGKESQLLVLNIFEDNHSMHKLSEFIGVKSDHTTFPHVSRN